MIALVRSEAKARLARAAGAQDVLVAGEGHVRPLVGRTGPLTRARQALVDLDEGRAAGKLVLEL